MLLWGCNLSTGLNLNGTLNINHWEKLCYMDFVNRTDMPDGGVY